MRLSMRYGNHMFAMPFYIIKFHVFPCSLVEMISEVHVSLGYRGSLCPHGISQCNRRTLTWLSITYQNISSIEVDRHKYLHKNKVQKIKELTGS